MVTTRKGKSTSIPFALSFSGTHPRHHRRWPRQVSTPRYADITHALTLSAADDVHPTPSIVDGNAAQCTTTLSPMLTTAPAPPNYDDDAPTTHSRQR